MDIAKERCLGVDVVEYKGLTFAYPSLHHTHMAQANQRRTLRLGPSYRYTREVEHCGP